LPGIFSFGPDGELEALVNVLRDPSKQALSSCAPVYCMRVKKWKDLLLHAPELGYRELLYE
jgi:hypothetical protein